MYNRKRDTERKRQTQTHRETEIERKTERKEERKKERKRRREIERYMEGKMMQLVLTGSRTFPPGHFPPDFSPQRKMLITFLNRNWNDETIFFK